MSSIKKIRFVLNYLSPIHYRKSLFELFYRDKRIDFNIVCGDSSPYGIKNYFDKKYMCLVPIKWFFIFNYQFIYLKSVWRNTIKLKPHCVVMLGFNPQILSSILDFIIYKMFCKTKIIWWGHGTLGNQGIVGRKIRLLFYNYSDGIIVYDDFGKKTLIEEGVSGDKIKIAGNCINKEDYGYLRFSDKKLLNIDTNNVLNFIFVGRINKEKRIDIAINALFNINTNRKLVFNIVGDGDYVDEIKHLVRNKFNNRVDVKLHGEKYGEQLDNLMLNSHMMLYPGSIGLSIIHSFSYGIPVLTHDNLIQQKPEFSYLQNGINGFLYKEGSEEDFTRVLQMIVAENDFYECRKNCLITAKKYTPEFVAENIINFIQNVCYE